MNSVKDMWGEYFQSLKQAMRWISHQRLLTIACGAIVCLSFFWLRMPSNGLVATYYDNLEWRGMPVFSTTETQINLDVFIQAIAQRGFPKEQISIAWNGWIRIDQTANYRFITESDDGSSVMIDDQLVVDNGGFHGPRRAKGEITLKTGMHRITISYFNGTGASKLLVLWRDANNRTAPLPSNILFSRSLSKDLEWLSRHWTAFSWFYLLSWVFACAIILKALEKHVWYKLGAALFCGMMIFMVLETLPWLPGTIILKMKTPAYSPLPEIIFHADDKDSASERLTFTKKEGTTEFAEYILPMPNMPITSFQLDPKVEEFAIQSLTIQTATTYDKWTGNDLQNTLQPLRNVQTSYDAEKNALKGHALGGDDPSLSFQHPIPNENRMPRPYAIVIAGGIVVCYLLAPILRNHQKKIEHIWQKFFDYLVTFRIVEVLILLALYMFWHGWDDLSMTIDTSIGVRLGRVGLLLVCLAGYQVMLAKLLPYPIEMFPLITLAGIMICLYFAAFLNGLLYAGYGLFILGIILFIIFWGLRLWRSGKRASSLAEYATPGMVLWAVITLLSYLHHDSAILIIGDEFILWGVYPKEIFLQNSLPDPVYSAIVWRMYPPGLAYFQYFAALILGYAEGHLLFAQSLHLIAGIILFVSRIAWKTIPKLMVILALGYFPLVIADFPFSRALRSTEYVLIFGLIAGILAVRVFLKNVSLLKDGFHLLAVVVIGYFSLKIYSGLPSSLLADAVVGLSFGSTLALYFLAEHQERRGIFILVFPLIGVLPLIKPIGLYLSIFASMVIFTDQTFLIWKTLRQRDSKRLTLRIWQQILLTIGLFITPFVVQATWIGYMQRGHFYNPQQINFTLHDLQRTFFSNQATSHEKAVITEFPAYLASTRQFLGSLHLPYWQVILLLYLTIPIGTIFLLRRISFQGMRYALANLVMGVCFVGYLGIHLLVYLYIMVRGEWQTLPAFQRYLDIYFLGWFWVILSFIISGLHLPAKRCWIAIGVLAAIMWGTITATPSSNIGNSPVSDLLWRTHIAKQAEEIRRNIPLRSKIYLIWQGVYGFDFLLMRYELAPRYTQFTGFSLGKKYAKLADWDGEDLYTVNYTVSEWAKILHEYDYVVIGYADDQFWNTYGSLFEQREKKIYRVVKTFSKTVFLKPIK